jgi:hypothetical protein
MVINQSKIRWAISRFKRFKSAGTSGILPALLQQGLEHLRAHLCPVFRARLARGYIPKAWTQVNVTFIPKPGKANYIKSKAYRLISLYSFMLKTMGKLLAGILGTRFWGYVPYFDNNMPTNQGSPLKLHCIK